VVPGHLFERENSAVSVKTAVDQMQRPLNIFDLGASQNRAYNAAGGASLQTTAFATTTWAIMIAVTGDGVRIAIGNDPTASSTSTLLLGPGMYIFAAPPGGKLAALSNDATPGTINVTELVGNSQR